MCSSFISEETLDDVLLHVSEKILDSGHPIEASKGNNIELAGVLLELKNPRARLSRTETRGKPFSCLGELCWYLAKSKDPDFICYYIPKYKDYTEGNAIYGAYGPRIFNFNNINQYESIKRILTKKPTSRQAVIQLFKASDIREYHKETPCTCTLQFMVRDNLLNMSVHMRSNDAHLGLPHDVFSFTMIQEMLARDLGVEIGTYKHYVGSLHIYDEHIQKVQQFLGEGLQPTAPIMPAMPNGNPWESIERLLTAEKAIRMDSGFDDSLLDGLDPYWGDLVQLLRIFRAKKNREFDQVRILKKEISSRVYHPFIDNILRNAN